MNNIAPPLKRLEISTLAQNCCNFSLIKISANWRFPGHFELNFSKIDMAPFRPKTITMLLGGAVLYGVWTMKEKNIPNKTYTFFE